MAVIRHYYAVSEKDGVMLVIKDRNTWVKFRISDNFLWPREVWKNMKKYPNGAKIPKNLAFRALRHTVGTAILGSTLGGEK